MDTKFAIEMFCWMLVLPAVISMAFSRLLLRVLAARFAVYLAFAGGLFIGYLNVRGEDALTDRLLPVRHWHWLAWIPIVAWVPLAFGVAKTAKPISRRIALLIVACVVPFLMMPGWQRLSDVRVTYTVVFVGTLWLALEAIDLAATRMKPAWLLALLCLSLGSASGSLMYFLSLTFGQLLLTATGAVLGVGLSQLRNDEHEAVRSVAPAVVAVLLAGCFLGFVDQDPPLLGFLVPVFVPVVIAAGAFAVTCCGMNSGKARRVTAVGQTLAVLGLFAGAGVWMHAATANPVEESVPPRAEPELSDEEWFDQLDLMLPASDDEGKVER